MNQIEELNRLFEIQRETEIKITKLISEMFPIGSEIRFERRSDVFVTAEVIDVSRYSPRLRVRNNNTDKEYCIDICSSRIPEVLSLPESTNQKAG